VLRDGKETSSADESAMGAAAAAAGMQQPEAAVAAAGTAGEACEAVAVNAGIQVQLNSIVDAYGDWYVQQVVRDVKGQGVLYAPQLRAFTAVAGQASAIQNRASLQELAALVKVRCCPNIPRTVQWCQPASQARLLCVAEAKLHSAVHQQQMRHQHRFIHFSSWFIVVYGMQVFGPYAAVKLSEQTELVVLQCLSQLDGCLERWKEVLDPVTMAVMVSLPCGCEVSRSVVRRADLLCSSMFAEVLLALHALILKALQEGNLEQRRLVHTTSGNMKW